MKLIKKSIVWILPMILLFSFTLSQQEGPYPEEYLLDPAVLVKTLKNPNAKQPVILNVGSMPLIKNAQSGGMCYSEDNMKEFKDKVAKLDKNQEIVVYCGCCKLETCPNVKLPYEYLKTAGFKNFKILNIPIGLYEDWTSKGYPMN